MGRCLFLGGFYSLLSLAQLRYGVIALWRCFSVSLVVNFIYKWRHAHLRYACCFYKLARK